jgi:hypothetical protein
MHELRAGLLILGLGIVSGFWVVRTIQKLWREQEELPEPSFPQVNVGQAWWNQSEPEWAGEVVEVPRELTEEERKEQAWEELTYGARLRAEARERAREHGR